MFNARHVHASVRNHKGLSSATVRPARFITVLAVLALPALQAGCSREAEKLVANERLIRGSGGLGNTVVAAPAPDRDTYVEPGTVEFGAQLFVGRLSTFEARTLLAVASWTLPDTTQPGFAGSTVSLELPRDLTLGVVDLRVDLSLSSSPWDTTTIAWPGPAASTLLAFADDDLTGAAFSIPLGPGGFDLVKYWAEDPSRAPGFILSTPMLLGVNAYQAGAAKFRVRYRHDVSGNSVFDSLDVPVTQDFFIRTPLVDPTGADTTLVLGGLHDSELALRFPLDSIPSDASINEATLVLNLAEGASSLDSADVGFIEVRRAQSDWPETATQSSQLNPEPAPFVTRVLGLSYQKAEQRLAVRIPGEVLRGWGLAPSTNFGLLVTLRGRNPAKPIDFASREASRPPEITMTYTKLPPVRF